MYTAETVKFLTTIQNCERRNHHIEKIMTVIQKDGNIASRVCSHLGKLQSDTVHAMAGFIFQALTVKKTTGSVKTTDPDMFLWKLKQLSQKHDQVSTTLGDLARVEPGMIYSTSGVDFDQLLQSYWIFYAMSAGWLCGTVLTHTPNITPEFKPEGLRQLAALGDTEITSAIVGNEFVYKHFKNSGFEKLIDDAMRSGFGSMWPLLAKPFDHRKGGEMTYDEVYDKLIVLVDEMNAHIVNIFAVTSTVSFATRIMSHDGMLKHISEA